MTEAPVRVGLAGEDEAHRILLQRLADEAACDVPTLEKRRQWVGAEDGSPYFKTSRKRKIADSGRPTYRAQRIEGEPVGFGSVFLDIFKEFGLRADIVLVLVDEDGDPKRAKAAHQAMEYLRRGSRRPAVFGVCNPTAEAWIVGVVGPERTSRAQALKRELGFDAVRNPHQLCSQPATDPRHAKRAANFLLNENHRSLRDAPACTPERQDTEEAVLGAAVTRDHLGHLVKCGLTPFLDRLREHYVPLVSAG